MRSVSLALLCLLLAGTADATLPGAKRTAAPHAAPPGEAAGAPPGMATPAAEPALPGADGLVRMRLKDVVLVNDAPAVLLVDAPEKRYLLIFIDFFMASAIRSGMDGPQMDRPLTHDLIGILLRRLGARVTRVTLTGLKDNTYYALLSVQVNAHGERADFDVRPSDALALAVRGGTPILAEPGLLHAMQPPGSGAPPGAAPPGAPPGQAPGTPPQPPLPPGHPAPKAQT